MRSITPDGNPAKARAMLAFSPMSNWTVEAIIRISSTGASWTSSTAMNKPFEPRAICFSFARRLISLEEMSNLAEAIPTLTPSEAEEKASWSWICSIRSCDKCGPAETTTAFQPSSIARSRRSQRRTVFPDPRGPVIRIRRAGAPTPDMRPSTNSREISSRPMIRGGSAPAVGRNGLSNLALSITRILRQTSLI